MGLQYGVPLEAFVDMYVNMRFEPAGMTDDPELRIATSLVDYIFRRMAVEYLSYEKREAMGIMTVAERMQPTLPGVDESSMPKSHSIDLPMADQAPSARMAKPTPAALNGPARQSEPVPKARQSEPAPKARQSEPAKARQSEMVLCHNCGDIMQRAGSCHACPSCGSTSGCS